MSDYKVKKQEESAAARSVGQDPGAAIQAPHFLVEAECLSPEGVRWKDGFHNVVVDEGRVHIVNELFGSKANMRFAFAVPHSIATNNLNSTHAYSVVSGSNVPGNNSSYKSLAGFTSNGTNPWQTASAQYTYGGNYTIHGAEIVFYSTSSMHSSVSGTNAIEYSEGSFAATRTVQNNDTLNITVTVSFGTA